MTCYYLLRNNQELGPYTGKELKAMELFTSDLIWINGESDCWRHPDEIEGFEGLALSPERVKKDQKETSSPAYTASTLTTQENSTAPAVLNEIQMAEEDPEPPSFEKLKDKYLRKAPPRKLWRSQTNIGANLMGIVVLLIGLSAAAFMIKKAVDNIEYEPVLASAEAKEITSEGDMSSTTSQLARRTAMSLPSPENDIAGQVNQAPVKEPGQSLTTDTELTAVKKEASQKQQAFAETQLQKQETAAEQQPAAGTTEDRMASEKAAEPESEKDEEKRSARPEVQVAANDYKVGFLGGISNLELSVANPTPKAVGKAVVEVEYLKPNGKVVASQLVEIPSIGPGTTKKVPVPDNSRGVSVRFRVVNVEG